VSSWPAPGWASPCRRCSTSSWRASRTNEIGSASGVLNAIQQFSAALGIALFATVFFAYLDAKHPPITAMKWTTLLSLIPLLLAFLAVFRLPQRPREGSS
jgi:hypothetical protein